MDASKAELEAVDLASDDVSERGGVQSVGIAATILKALAAGGGVLPLKHLAAATGMPRAKVHRYLASLRGAGLITQDAETGHYAIGPEAVTIGLVGLAHRFLAAGCCVERRLDLRRRVGERLLTRDLVCPQPPKASRLLTAVLPTKPQVGDWASIAWSPCSNGRRGRVKTGEMT